MAPPLKSIINKTFKKIDLSASAKGVLHNKYVLYLIFAAALINLLHNAIKADYTYCAVFILVGFVTAFFNKNMIVILTITMAASAIIHTVIRGVGFEGFQEGATDKADADEKTVPVISDASIKVPSKGVMGNVQVSSKTDLIDRMKKDAVDLMSVQNEIISGFQTIEPAMDRAEALIGSIQTAATTIEGLKNGMVPQ